MRLSSRTTGTMGWKVWSIPALIAGQSEELRPRRLADRHGSGGRDQANRRLGTRQRCFGVQPGLQQTAVIEDGAQLVGAELVAEEE